MENNNEKEVLLSVRHLCQYFKLGNKELKAVDDVSFDIHKGEVLGLVGESGCGKTTTGRSIIRLYDITGGSVYLEGKRICAGIRPYKQAVKDAKAKFKTESKKLKDEYQAKVNAGTATEEDKTVFENKTRELELEMLEVVKENSELIKSAKFDHKNCNKEFKKFEMQKVSDEYLPKLEAETDPEKHAAYGGAENRSPGMGIPERPRKRPDSTRPRRRRRSSVCPARFSSGCTNWPRPNRRACRFCPPRR